MLELNLKNLRTCIETAKKDGYKFIGVSISVNDATPEIIINPRENFDDKLAYYENAYNEDLTLKAVPTIKITGFTFANSFDEIQNDLV